MTSQRITARDVSIVRTHDGGYEVATIADRRRIAIKYFGFRRREAVRLFLRDVKQQPS